MRKKLLLLFSKTGFLILLCLLFGCGAAKPPEQLESEAAALYQQADNLWKTGKEKEAFPLYDKIANEYTETETAKILRDELIIKKLNFGSTADSWTNIRLFELENLLVEIYKETGEFPAALETGLDAWNVRIKYKLFDTKKVDFDFMVVSAGPDKKFDTGDDVRLVHARDKTPKGVKVGGVSGSEAKKIISDATLENIDKAVASQTEGLEDKEVNLKDLSKLGGKKKIAKGVKSAEKEVDLSDLLQDDF